MQQQATTREIPGMTSEEVLNCQMFLSYLKRAALVSNNMPLWANDEARIRAQRHQQIAEHIRPAAAEALRYLSDKLKIRYEIVLEGNMVALRDMAYIIALAEQIFE